MSELDKEQNKGGRPTKFQSVEELEGLADCQIKFVGNYYFTNDFKTENELRDYIIINIEIFCSSLLNDKFISFKKDYNFQEVDKFGPRRKRVDLYIKGEKKEYIIECKNPKYPRENISGVGQLLDYGRKYLDPKKETELVLITSKYDIDTYETIKHYNLPIRYIYLDKTRNLEAVN